MTHDAEEVRRFSDFLADPDLVTDDLKLRRAVYLKHYPEATDSRRHVAPEYITAQRAAGWPDIHPEDYCHRCGTRNPLWFTDRDTWVTATAAWAAQTGREGICCPQCFAEMHQQATGHTTIWRVSAEGDAR